MADTVRGSGSLTGARAGEWTAVTRALARWWQGTRQAGTPAEAPESDLMLVSRAASLLDISEFELFRLAHERWRGRQPDERSLDHEFVEYMFRERVPCWVRHLAREICSAAAAGDLNVESYRAPRQALAPAERLRGIDEYVARFMAVYGLSGPDDISFVHAANAIAAFESVAWRADNSAFDRYLRGDKKALSPAQLSGMRIFYSKNKGGCAACHSGPFQTDHSFRAIAVPQIGPGKGDGWSGREDFGRERVTGRPADRYKFRVPSLRNVALTAPYGHSGAFGSLEAVARHHLDAPGSLERYDRSQARLPQRDDLAALDFLVMDNPQLRAEIAAAAEIPSRYLSKDEFSDLLEFLHALTDPGSIDLRDDVPHQVPSGIPLAE